MEVMRPSTDPFYFMIFNKFSLFRMQEITLDMEYGIAYDTRTSAEESRVWDRLKLDVCVRLNRLSEKR